MHIEGGELDGNKASIRIANQTGQVLYSEEIPLAVMDTEVNQDFEFQLESILSGGLYTIMLIAGTTTIARKIIIQQ